MGRMAPLHRRPEGVVSVTTDPEDLIIAEGLDPDAKSWPILLGAVALRIDLIETERGYRAHRMTHACEYLSVERTYAVEVLEDVAYWIDNPLAPESFRIWIEVLQVSY
jgi:hypothetical protein